MLSHVCIGTNAFPRAFAFYTRIMSILGNPLRFSELKAGWAAWQPAAADRPLFIVGRAYNGEAATAGNGQMVALLAPNRKAVDQAHAAAISDGATCEGRPGLRPHYHPNYYGAYFRDLDGNKVCVCCHDS